MNPLIYGFWDGVFYDNRQTFSPTAPEDLPLDQFSQFNPGNPIMTFVGDKGFLVLDRRADLAFALWRYYQRAAKESCGKCTPCRTGSLIIAEALEKAVKGHAADVDWDFVESVATQMKETSLCGIGLTTPTAFLAALHYCPNEIRHAQATPEALYDYYSLLTAPCVEACPAHVDIPRYIDYIKAGEPELSAAVLLKHYPLVGSCGRVCVRYCEKACRRRFLDEPVDIKNLKRYAADATGPMQPLFHNSRLETHPLSPKVAVIGAGPAGINCAYHLLLQGYEVDIFEANSHAGGMAQVGIPQYRLPKGLLESETEVITELGGRYFYRQRLGYDFSLSDLFKRGYNAIFIGVGCSKGMYLGLDNEDTTLSGYFNGIDFLHKVERSVAGTKPMKLKGDVVVVGGGNVAMDCARSAVRMTDGTVHVIYRRTEEGMPADHEEVLAAKAEGIQFHFLSVQKEILSENGKVTGLKIAKMREEKVPGAKRGKLIEIEGTDTVIGCDTLIAAIGQRLDQQVLCDDDGIMFDRRGNIQVSEALATTRPGVFAGGDSATGPTTLIDGMAQGQIAAQSIHEYLTRGSVGFVARRRMSELLKRAHILDEKKPTIDLCTMPRHQLKTLSVEQRRGNFEEVDLSMTGDEAIREANRCMRCYRIYAVTTQLPIPGNLTHTQNQAV
ncbi:MAG TPA: FAD-dependent oxidoreductase [Candidatus Aphodousia faecipullorum]|nr:FAD-dependent oxidoreductase [Candidatus Aphodousia faecipullorum]